MSAEDNKALIRRLIDEFFNEQNLDLVDELFAADCPIHDPHCPDGMAGPGLVKALGQLYNTAFPDLHYEVQDMVCEDDKVVTRWKATGTNTGAIAMSETLTLPPSGKELDIEGMTICRVKDGKIVDLWQNCDKLTAYQQVGAAFLVEDPGDFEEPGVLDDLDGLEIQ